MTGGVGRRCSESAKFPDEDREPILGLKVQNGLAARAIAIKSIGANCARIPVQISPSRIAREACIWVLVAIRKAADPLLRELMRVIWVKGINYGHLEK